APRAMGVARNEKNERVSLIAVSSSSTRVGRRSGEPPNSQKGSFCDAWLRAFWFCPFTLLRKKALQQRPAFGFAHTGRDFTAVVHGRELEKIQGTPGRAAFRVARPVNQPREPDVNDRAGAHRTRLLGHVNRAVSQPPVTDCLFG